MSTDDTRKLPEGFDIIIARLDSYEKRMDSFEQNITTHMDSLEQAVNSRMDSFEQRLTELEDKVDARLKETRPVLEAVQAQSNEIKEGMEKGFRKVNHRLDIISGDINQVRADLHDHESRIEKLEGPHQ